MPEEKQWSDNDSEGDIADIEDTSEVHRDILQALKKAVGPGTAENMFHCNDLEKE